VKGALVALAVTAGAATGFAQDQYYEHGEMVKANPAYDGQFTFARLRYGEQARVVSRDIPWSHDYPIGEQNFMRILDEVSLVRPKTDETSVLGLDEPELYRHPIVYMAEPGYWTITEDEAAGFREYLQKGGFVIFDDFAENRGGWAYFEYQMAQVMPELRWVELDGSHPIFHSFFEIPAPHDFLPPYDRGLRPIFYGLYENNDPEKRLIAIANYNNDISEYWEYSETGLNPIDDTNEAYKFGVNYIIYGMTH
jgi:hypothetical protein